MNYIGIDPGEKGAIAFLNESGAVINYCLFKDISMKALLTDWSTTRVGQFTAVIEKLWGMPIRGCQANWSLGGNYKNWQFLLDLADVSYVEIPPTTWQKFILHTSKKTSKETKKLSLAYVNKRYPDIDLPQRTIADRDSSSGVSDALCMALYCRHLHLNVL